MGVWLRSLGGEKGRGQGGDEISVTMLMRGHDLIDGHAVVGMGTLPFSKALPPRGYDEISILCDWWSFLSMVVANRYSHLRRLLYIEGCMVFVYEHLPIVRSAQQTAQLALFYAV